MSPVPSVPPRCCPAVQWPDRAPGASGARHHVRGDPPSLTALHITVAMKSFPFFILICSQWRRRRPAGASRTGSCHTSTRNGARSGRAGRSWYAVPVIHFANSVRSAKPIRLCAGCRLAAWAGRHSRIPCAGCWAAASVGRERTRHMQRMCHPQRHAARDGSEVDLSVHLAAELEAAEVGVEVQPESRGISCRFALIN